jgi:hypothetical protein
VNSVVSFAAVQRIKQEIAVCTKAVIAIELVSKQQTTFFKATNHNIKIPR